VALIARIVPRLLLGVVVLWGAATLTFLAISVIPGDTALLILGGPDARPTPEALAAVRAEYLLDEPIVVQYLHYLGSVARGDLGQSYRLRIPVTEAIGQQLGSTATLAGVAAALAVTLTVVVAVLSAQRSPWIRRIVSSIEVFLSAAPSFVIGFGLLFVFAFTFRLLPSGGSNGIAALVLPAVTLALVMFGPLTQVLEEVLEQPFVLTARTRGLGDLAVRLGHALRHAAIPAVTMTGFIVGGLLGGSVIAETLFSRSGVGSLMLQSVYNKDLPVILGVVLLSAAVFVVVNLVIDLLYTAIDPRMVTS
jgi:peptide/nickel transport system permease protein